MYGRQSTKKATQDFDIGDIDELLNSTMKDVDEDLDMNDPELLKQLQEISSLDSSSVQKKKAPVQKSKKPVSTIQNMDIDIDSYAALAQGDDDIEVDLDENDMQDPHLLGELSSLSKTVEKEEVQSNTPEVKELMNMGFSSKQASKALDMFDNNLERAANYLFDSPPTVEEEEEEEEMVVKAAVPIPEQQAMSETTEQKEDEDEVEPVDPQFWKEKAQHYQQLALAAKKSGDKKKAVTLLRESKNYNQKYQDLLEIHSSVHEEQPTTVNSQTREQLSTTAADTVASTEKPLPESHTPVLSATPASEPASQANVEETTQHRTPQELQQVQDILGKLITLQKQYKEAALHYKKLGNLGVAKTMVRTSKELLHMGIQLKNGEITDPNTVRLPSPPDMSLGDGKAARQVELVTHSSHHTSFDQVEAQITYQMNVCHNLSVQSASPGRKTNSRTLVNTQLQDAYAKAEEAYAADLVSLNASKPNIPPLHYEQVDYVYKNFFEAIPDNMMEFKIVRALSLPTLDISTSLEPFVTWDFGGWPPENTAQAAMNKGETPVVSGINPEFDFSLLIPISRTNRLFQRYLQRKKLTIEVFHNKYTYGLFRRPVSLGKVVVPMDQLLTKTSISGVFDLLDGGRKKTGGKVEIQVNLREPLSGEDIAKRSERWLVLDAFGSTVSECLSLAGMTVGGPYRSEAATPGRQSENTPTPVSPSPSSTPAPVLPAPAVSQEPSSKDSNSELEAAEDEFNSVDNIVSNMVMEHELNLVNTGLSTSKSAKEKEDLMDRKQALDIKMNMLVIQVQTGILDMDTYLQNVQKRMDADRRLALVFKKHNRLDLAKAALVRKKIMQDELEEAKAAMAAEE